MSAPEPNWSFSGLPEPSPPAENPEQPEEDVLDVTKISAPAEERAEARAENVSANFREASPPEDPSPEGPNDAVSVGEKVSYKDWLEAELDKLSEQIARIYEHTASIPTMIERGTELEQAYEIVARNTQTLNDRLAQVDVRSREVQGKLEALNERSIKHEGATHILKDQYTQLAQQGSAMTLQQEKIFYLNGQIFQGLGAHLSMMEKMSERLYSLATAELIAQHAAENTDAGANSKAWTRPVSEFFENQSPGVWGALLLILTVVLVKLFEMNQESEF